MLEEITATHAFIYINRNYETKTEIFHKEKFTSCKYREKN